jgi:glycosyltransferase involved in cell wall biosynthesis
VEVVVDAPRITILLPTYNGARHVAQQIASIQEQTVTDWQLLVRDDGSSDRTLETIRKLAGADPRIEIVTDGDGNVGCVANVGRLMTLADARGTPYIMLADQDDVWTPRKIEATLATMESAEQKVDAGFPILVHTDLAVVDEDLRPLDPSFMHFQRMRHEEIDALRTLFVQNFVTGCTVLMNRALLHLALPMPYETPMHDWWLALCAAAVGTIAFVPESTVLYRQHGQNVVSDKGYVRRLKPLRTNWARLWLRGNVSHRQSIAQVGTLVDRLKERGLGESSLYRLQRFLALFEPGMGPIARVRGGLALELRSQHVLRTALVYSRLALGVHDRVDEPR